MNQNPNTPTNFNPQQNRNAQVKPPMNPGMQNQPMNQNPQMKQPPNANLTMRGTTPPKVNNASQFIQEGDGKTAEPKKKKKVLSRELVTILGVLAIVGILYFTYNYQLNKNLEIIDNVPVAKEKIKAGTRITAEMIENIPVPNSTLSSVKAVTNSNEIIGKYVNYDTIIPANSFFYSEALSSTDTAPNSIFKDLIESEAAIMITVDLETTYGNTIMPGDIVDIYADARNVNNKGTTEYIAGPLVTGAKVLAVLDSAGNNVFADHENKLYPAYFVFTLNSDIIKLIRKAKILSESEYAMTLYPVVDGKTYKGNGATEVNRSQIVDLINNATVDIKNNNN